MDGMGWGDIAAGARNLFSRFDKVRSVAPAQHGYTVSIMLISRL